MMAKSLALKVQAERVEQTPARKQAVMAESNRIGEQARFTSADGSPIPKTVDDEWREGPGAVFVGSPPTAPSWTRAREVCGRTSGLLPARMSLGRYYQSLGDAINEPGAKSVAARTQHFQAADVQLTRAVRLAADPPTPQRRSGADRSAGPGSSESTATGRNLGPVRHRQVSRSADAGDQSGQCAGAGRQGPDRRRGSQLAGDSASHGGRTARRRGVPVGDGLEEQGPAQAGCRELLGEATGSLDAALKMRPDYMEAIVYKSLVLRLQAERVEQDAARIKSLQAEANRLAEQAKKLRSGGR